MSKSIHNFAVLTFVPWRRSQDCHSAVWHMRRTSCMSIVKWLDVQLCVSWVCWCDCIEMLRMWRLYNHHKSGIRTGAWLLTLGQIRARGFPPHLKSCFNRLHRITSRICRRLVLRCFRRDCKKENEKNFWIHFMAFGIWIHSSDETVSPTLEQFNSDFQLRPMSYDLLFVRSAYDCWRYDSVFHAGTIVNGE